MTITGDIASIGECMVELAPTEGGFYQRSFAGDTLNTAWYMRALLAPAMWGIRYVSAVGTDGLSDSMVEFLEANALDTRSVARLLDSTVGLYLITLADAERSFTYWRSMSAARQLAADPGRLAAALDGVGLVYLSGITLAILEPDDRSRLFAALEALRQRGGEVAFDPNIRPKLWLDRATMAAVITEGYRVATIALPTFPDDAELYGDESPTATADRITALGVGEIVVKDGAAPAFVRFGQQEFTVPAVEAQPVDTTGAGDSFNGGYLAARVAGREPFQAAALGHAVAARVISHRGAIAYMGLFTDLRVG